MSAQSEPTHDFYFGGSVSPSFDDEKFAALDCFLNQVKGSENVPFNDDLLEDLQLSFLERCDSVLIRMAMNYLEKEEVDSVHDATLRETLVDQLTKVPDEREEDSLLFDVEDALLVLEEIEDVSETWLLVALLDLERLKRLYADLSALKKRQEDSEVEAVRAAFYDLMNHAPLLTPETRLYFYLVVEHLECENMVAFIDRFLRAELEYGRYLQDEYLRLHPDFSKQVTTRFNREATIMAKRCTK